MLALRNRGKVRGASPDRRLLHAFGALPLSTCEVGHGAPRRDVSHGSFDPLRRRSHPVSRQLREFIIASQVWRERASSAMVDCNWSSS